MRFFFHVSDCARVTFVPDWRGKEFEDVEEALGFARSLRSELAQKFQGYVLVSNDNAVKVAVLGVNSSVCKFCSLKRRAFQILLGLRLSRASLTKSGAVAVAAVLCCQRFPGLCVC